MKKFPRFLQLLPLFLLLVAAMSYDAAAQSSFPPSITSFTASKTSITKGEAVILNWRVFRAEHIWISYGDRLNTLECLKETFGQMTVKPEQTTTYRLHAWTAAGHVSIDVTIQVAAVPAGFCTISGVIGNNKPEYNTTVRLFIAGARTPTFTARVGSAGQYIFTNLPAGNYRISPRGNYPSDGSYIGPIPNSEEVVCRPGLTIRRNFRIGSNEG